MNSHQQGSDPAAVFVASDAQGGIHGDAGQEWEQKTAEETKNAKNEESRTRLYNKQVTPHGVFHPGPEARYDPSRLEE